MVKFLPAWIGSGVLEWRGEEGMPSAIDREAFWMNLGVDSVVVDLVVKMGLWWDEESEHLVVLDKWMMQENIYQRIQDALLGVWDFKKPSQTAGG